VISKARAFAAATLLGLPVALLAHALVFGGRHAAGGALNSLAVDFAAFALLLIIALHSRELVQGSVLAARLRAQRPRFAALMVSGSAWFAILELSERSHSVHLTAIAAALIIACLAIRAAVNGVTRSVAAVAIVLSSHGAHVPAVAESHIRLRYDVPHALRSFAHTRRLFSRPPPALS
jgi:hypothetical protein